MSKRWFNTVNRRLPAVTAVEAFRKFVGFQVLEYFLRNPSKEIHLRDVDDSRIFDDAKTVEEVKGYVSQDC